MNKNALRLWRQFQGHNSTVIAHMPPQTSKEKCPVAEKSFGMYDICIHRIVTELRLMEKKEKEEEEEKEGEEEVLLYFLMQ